jgi:hypothetical protein
MRRARTLGFGAWTILGLGTAFSLVACSAGPQTTTGGTTGSPAMTTASPTGTVVASIATPQPTEPFAIKEGPLAPGRYLQAGFSPGVSFVLGTGWQAFFDDKDSAFLGRPDNLALGINKPPKVVDPKTGQPADTPADLADWLAKSPAFDSATSTAVTVGGMPATLVEATSSVDRALFYYASGNFHTVPGTKSLFYVFPLDGPDLLVMFLGPTAAFEADLPMIKTIVDSITVGGS